MSAYINLKTLEYPRHEGDIRLAVRGIAPGLTGDQFPCPESYALVHWVDRPSYNVASEVIEETAPVSENGVWKMSWKIRQMTQEEIAIQLTMP
jgi:hypothetical protein